MIEAFGGGAEHARLQQETTRLQKALSQEAPRRRYSLDNVVGQSKTMQRVYLGACVVAGAFTLLPQRLLGQWLWSQMGLL